MNFKNLLHAAIFPEFCINCGNLDRIICNKCLEKVEKIDFPTCLICGNLSNKGETHRACMESVNIKTYNTYYVYNSIIKRMILRSKTGPLTYNHLSILINETQNISLLKLISKNIDCLAPVPMNPKNKKRRLIDQSNYIATQISNITNIPKLDLFLIKKSIENKALNRSQRFLNSTGKFDIRKSKVELAKGKKILLIDDIATTGATLIECSNLLFKSGAKEISAYTLAREV